MIYSGFDKDHEIYSKKITEELSPHKDEPIIQVRHGDGFLKIDRCSPVLWPSNFKESETQWLNVPLVVRPTPSIASNEWDSRLISSYVGNQNID